MEKTNRYTIYIFRVDRQMKQSTWKISVQHLKISQFELESNISSPMFDHRKDNLLHYKTF